MSKIVRFHEIGGPDVLRIEELDPGLPGPDEVLVKLSAIGLNRAEAAFRRNEYLVTPTLPSRLGGEGVGVIQKLGSNVTGFAVGERVCAIQTTPAGVYGLYATEAVTSADGLIKAPEDVDDITAAGLWVPYITAYGMLHEFGHIKPGDHVLILAASSSVGQAAIQMVRASGGIPIAACRSEAKAERLRELGIDVIFSTDEDLIGQLMTITGGKGVDILLDPVAGKMIDTWVEAMAPEGRIFIYGGLSGEPTPYPRRPAMRRMLNIHGFEAKSILTKPERLARAEAYILKHLRSGAFTPTIDRVFAFTDIVAAHTYLESGQQMGKIVLKV